MNLIGIILEILCNIIIIYSPESLLCLIINKALLTYLSAFICIFVVYVLTISYKGKNVDNYNKRVKKVVLFVWLIFEVFILALPVYIYKSNTAIYSYGPSPNIVFLISFLCIVICLYSLVKNIKQIKHKKYTPLFAYIIGGTACGIIQKMYPAFTLVVPMETFMLYLMYFSIENPDLKMIEELNLAKDRADKANRAKTEFLSSMSHEIRTPLNAIVGFSNSIVDDIEKDKEQAKEDARYIINASQSLLEIVNGILDISKIEANKIEIVDVEYNTKDVLDNLVALSKARLGEKPIEFRTSFDESIPEYLYGDSSRIKQIIINLLTNSIKYTNEGFIEFRVDSIIKDDVVRLIISVEDSGIGIKKEDINKLFDKFSRLDLEKNLSIEGSGLGLAITKKLIDMMNGTIVVQSEYGVGSKFTVAIDQKIVKEPSRKPLEVRGEKALNEFPGKKVLVVDDNKLNLKVAEKVLEPFKLSVTCVESGDAGIEEIIKNTYDLVLLDDMMPGKSGVETLKEIHETLEDYKIPTVALTANAIAGMKEKYLSDGFDDYLAKPIEKEELKRVLNRYLK